MEDKIKNPRRDSLWLLLQEADQKAGLPAPLSSNLSSVVRHRAHQRRFIRLAAPLAAAAVVLIAAGIWNHNTTKTREEQRKIVLLETQLNQLQAKTDAALDLIRAVLNEEQKQRQYDELDELGKLEAQLASMPDPLKEIERQVGFTAFYLLGQADRLYRELNRTESAVEAYNRLIELFPKNRWAKEARQRLSEIESKKFNKMYQKESINEIHKTLRHLADFAAVKIRSGTIS